MTTLNPMELLGKWLGRDDYVEAPVITEGEAYIERGGAWHYAGVASGTGVGGFACHCCYVDSDDKEMDFLYAVTSSQHALMEFYESPVLVTTGTSVSGHRLNRAVGDVQGTDRLLIWSEPTLINPGTLLSSEFFPVGVAVPGRGHVIPGGKWCLKPRTWYYLRVYNVSASASFIGGMAEWWERDSIWAEKNEVP